MLVEVTDISGNWVWYKHPASFKLAKGLQTIRLAVYEPGWDWDKIALIANGVTGPSGSTMGETGPNLSNVSNSSGFAAARLKFSDDADTNVVVSALGLQGRWHDPAGGLAGHIHARSDARSGDEDDQGSRSHRSDPRHPR